VSSVTTGSGPEELSTRVAAERREDRLAQFNSLPARFPANTHDVQSVTSESRW